MKPDAVALLPRGKHENLLGEILRACPTLKFLCRTKAPPTHLAPPKPAHKKLLTPPQLRLAFPSSFFVGIPDSSNHLPLQVCSHHFDNFSRRELHSDNFLAAFSSVLRQFLHKNLTTPSKWGECICLLHPSARVCVENMADNFQQQGG